jgi:hypothetical protein
MIKKILVLISLLCSQLSHAQDTIKPPEVPVKEDQLIVCITSDNWSGLPSGFTAKPVRSRGFTFLAMDDRMFGRGNFGIGFGIGFNSQNVHTDAVVSDTTADLSSASLIKIPDSLHYKLNKLSLNFITAAFEIRLRSNENEHGNHFKLSVGMMAEYLLQSHTKYEDNDGKLKTYGVKHLNKFQYGVMARAGYSNFALYGYFSLAKIFKDGEGPELTPYSLGISFTF